MTGIWANTFVPSAISISSFFNEVIVMPFTLRCGHAGRVTLPIPRSSDHLPMAALVGTDAANYAQSLEFLHVLIDMNN